MIDKGRPLYIFNSSGLKPHIKVSFSDKQVIVDTFYDYGRPTSYNRNISKLKLLPAIGYNQDALEALLNNEYNDDDDDEYDCNYGYDADDDEDTADDEEDDDSDDDDEEDNDSDDDEEDDEW